MIDLHLHTTASDGQLDPADLVRLAVETGLSVMSVTDHDTVAGLADARRAASGAGLAFIDGIEITAVDEGRDVHILGYFIRPAETGLGEFLAAQRERRVDRLREIARRLQTIGVPVDVEALIARVAERPGASIGRPVLARALVASGHVGSVRDAFDRYLGMNRPAFVPRAGRPPADVVRVIHEAGGLASMAHPGVTRRPDVLATLVEEGLDAVEAYHSDHSPDTTRQLLDFAARYRILVTGGSDFHGDDLRDRPLGGVALPADELARLRAAQLTRSTSP